MSLPTLAIIGIPNVGKSRLFNRLVGEKKAIVSNVSGTTRDRIIANVENVSIPFTLVDTGGIVLGDRDEALDDDIKAQASIAIEDANIILLLIEHKESLTSEDIEIVNYLRKKNKDNIPVFLIVSKCDNVSRVEGIHEFYSLGVNPIFQVSSLHNIGIKDLLLSIEQELKKQGYKKAIQKSDALEDNSSPTKIPKISFIGRPNVGKSSLINAYMGDERLIVSDIAGTTRDATDTLVNWEKKPFIFTDTAGIRKRGKIEQGIEKWALARTFQNLQKTDVTCLVISADEGIVSQDQHIIEQVFEAKTGLVLIINKWDLEEKGEEAQKEFLIWLQQKFPFVLWTPVLFTSALSKRNIFRLFPLVEDIIEERGKRITTGKLNSFLLEIMRKHPPKGTKRVSPKIFYIT
ncbi:ribosome biogenesis GTPase Der, partial [Candidatus Peregrinibacteria bacterium]|nr:ribosome biogenesis GTPase Der [Candidatus Peregrinibacteria bacterium]